MLAAVTSPALPCPRGGIERAVEMPQSAGAIDAYDTNYAMTGVGTVAGRYQIAGARRSLTAHRAPVRRYYALQRLIPIERTERPPAFFIPFHHHRNIMTGLEGLEIG
jgi:hypothetical protein